MAVLASAPLEFAGTSIRFSPFDETLVAVATAANFGIVGNGALVVLRVRAPPAPIGGPPAHPHPRLTITTETRLLTNDAVCDCAWSEMHEDHVAGVCGDGSLKLWDLRVSAAHGGRPLCAVRAHEGDAHGVDWSNMRKNELATCGWDGVAKSWDAERLGDQPLCTFAGHGAGVYEARWAPRRPGAVATAGADGTTRVWAAESGRAEVILSGHGGEVLSVDWNKYADHMIATACVDRVVRIWDLRSPASPVSLLLGHGLAVRRVRWSPHDQRHLLSASYDMTVALWDAENGRRGEGVLPLPPQGNDMLKPVGPSPAPSCGAHGDGHVAPLTSFRHHTEFTVGVDWALFQPTLCASCAWDGTAAFLEAPPPAPVPAPGQ